MSLSVSANKCGFVVLPYIKYKKNRIDFVGEFNYKNLKRKCGFTYFIYKVEPQNRIMDTLYLLKKCGFNLFFKSTTQKTE
jgi:hypothetical protein